VERIYSRRRHLGTKRNTKKLVKEFEEEYSEIGRVKKRRNNKEDKRGELLGRYIAKILYR